MQHPDISAVRTQDDGEDSGENALERLDTFRGFLISISDRKLFGDNALERDFRCGKGILQRKSERMP